MLKIKGMKKQYHTVKLPVVLILLMMAISFCLQAQSTVKTYSVNPDQSKNYILTITPQEASTKLGVSTFIGSTRRSDQVKDEIGYFDGLGRALQSIGVNASPGGKDILLPTEYDEFGKETKKYLPYTVDGNNGLFRNNAISEQQSFYSLRYPNEPAFQQTILDGSQLSVVVQQGAPGAAWQPHNPDYANSGHVLFYSHYFDLPTDGYVYKWFFNEATNKIYHWDIGDNSMGYEATTTWDENGNKSAVLTNRVDGKVIMTESDGLQTYYVYDDFGLLRCVIPPTAKNGTTTDLSGYSELTASTIQTLCYTYNYDSRKRLIEKRLPGAEPVYMVYDNRDRLVMTQDGNQRTLNQWSFIKYDVLNRPVLTGIYNHGSSIGQAAMSNLINTTNLCERYNGTAETHGYTNTVFPSANIDVLSVTYYDNYSFKNLIGATLNYVPNEVAEQPASEFTTVKGLVTGTKVKVLGSSTFLCSVSYYDDQYRSIQTLSQNHKGGIDLSTSQLDFSGKALHAKTSYNDASGTTIIKRRFVYDHAGRLLKTYHQVNNNAEVLLSANTYNEIGQIAKKDLHSTDNGSTFKQNLDYQYNIRGWLEKINDPNAPGSDLFTMELRYNNPTAKGGSSQYNGNISESIWKSTGTDKQSYGYTYDTHNRLTQAAYYNQTQPALNGSFTEKVTSYDANGNIRGVVRYGQKDYSVSPYGLMDNLTYTYQGNKVTRIDDAMPKNAAEEGFKEETKESNEYTYDANGNMKTDKNKQIASITYNHLNLPVEVIKINNEKIKYTYDASGRKLSQEVFGAAPKRTDYRGELIYENNVLELIHHDEGRVVMMGAPEYQYTLKDHLGNVRFTFTSKVNNTPAVATFELENAQSEEAKFERFEVSRRVLSSLFDRTNGSSPGYAQRLNGTSIERYGLAKSLSVITGDVVNLEVYAKYVDLNDGNLGQGLQQILAAIAQNISPGTVVDGIYYNDWNTTVPFSFPGVLNTSESTGNGPPAYLNWLIFDKNYNFVSGGYQRLSEAAKEQGQDVAHEKLSATLTITQPGYVYVYLSNEDTYQQYDVFFDDFTVQHVKSPIIQSSDYYAFGAPFNNFSRENSLPQKHLYQSKEWQTDLGLNLYDFEWRQYDPITLRTTTMDPHAESYYAYSPYSWVFNNPVSVIDPTGMDGMSYEEEQVNDINNAIKDWRKSQKKNDWGTEFLDGEMGESSCTCGCPGKPPCAKENPDAKKANLLALPLVIVEGVSVTAVAGLGLIALLGTILQGDAVDTRYKKDDEKRKIFYHYTNAAGLAGIMSTGKITPDPKGNVYITDMAMSAAEAFQNLFLCQPTHTGKGDYVVSFYLDKNQESQLKYDPREMYQYTWPNGTLKINKVLWGAPNPFNK
jgi:RHS repeat-associated protein